MDYRQPWPPGTGFSRPPGGTFRPLPAPEQHPPNGTLADISFPEMPGLPKPAAPPGEPFTPDTVLSVPAGATYAERLEAAMLAMRAGFAWDGYQVVRREYTSSRFSPSLTIRSDSIFFNSACLKEFTSAAYVLLNIHPEKKALVIRPCGAATRDAVRWCVVREDESRGTRQITCPKFTKKLYPLMGWDMGRRYRIQGFHVDADHEDAFMFVLSLAEPFLPQKKDPVTGRAMPQEEIPDPLEKEDGFGLAVPDHRASMSISLKDGFSSLSAFEEAVDG